jgi:hypothetical protein
MQEGNKDARTLAVTVVVAPGTRMGRTEVVKPMILVLQMVVSTSTHPWRCERT